MITFEQCWEYAAQLEGFDKVVNHPKDPGGRTAWGITERDHPDLWVGGPPTKEAALARWERNYWHPRYNSLTDVRIGRELLEAGLLCGRHRAIKFLQKAYNAIAYDGDSVLAEDGVYGPTTEAVIVAFMSRGVAARDALLNAANGEQYIYFKSVGNRAFMRGWASKRITASATTPGK